jgi:hypothetical protein
MTTKQPEIEAPGEGAETRSDSTALLEKFPEGIEETWRADAAELQAWKLRSICEKLERENELLTRVVDLARDAVESGAVEECYLSLMRDAIDQLSSNAEARHAPATQPETQT